MSVNEDAGGEPSGIGGRVKVEGLTSDQRQWVKAQFSTWLRLRESHQKDAGLPMLKWIEKIPEEQRGRQVLTQFRADIDHSALLDRLLSGKEALPEPPDTEHAYPKYPD